MAKKIKSKLDRNLLQRRFRREFSETEVGKLDLLTQDNSQIKDHRKKKKMLRKAVLIATAPEKKS